jgi:hypothetical protein
VDVGPIGRTTVNLVLFSHFVPNHAKARTCGSDPRNKLGGAILTSYIGAVCGNRISRSFWYERGLFPSFQAPPSTMSLGTRAFKHPIEQPPQPLDRSSLDLQNPERSSSLEAPRALTRHWSSRLSCPRATTRGRAATISEIVVPGIYSDQDHHQRIDHLLIYRCTVEKTRSEK